MALLKKLTLTTGFLTVALACYLYTPIPEGYSKPWTVHVSLSTYKLVKTLGNVGEALGLAQAQEIRKPLLNTLAKLVSHMGDDGTLEVVDTEFDGVPVRIYTPKGKPANNRPGFVYYHGGGWNHQSVISYDPLVRRLAKGLNNAVVVSVEYRLAPENIFPAAFDDCMTVTKYLLKNAAEFGVDASRIGIGGDSAGGHLAATVSMKLRDEKADLKNKVQVLLYPVTQAVDFMTPSYQANADDPLLDLIGMERYWSLFLLGHRKHGPAFVKNEHTSPALKKQLAVTYMDVSKLPKELIHDGYVQPKTDYGDEKQFKELKDILLNPYVSPLLAKDLSDLPKAYVFTCQHDVLRDEGIWYAQRLKEAGVDVTHRHSDIAFHGVLIFGDIPEAVDFLQEIVTYINANL